MVIRFDVSFIAHGSGQNYNSKGVQIQLNILWNVAWMIPADIWWRHNIETLSWASFQIRKIAGCACAGNAGNVFPRRQFQMKPLVSDPGMHHGTCVTHVPWCMSGSLTCGDGENVPGIPGACAPAILRIWQEAHGPFYTESVTGGFLSQRNSNAVVQIHAELLSVGMWENDST